MNVEQVVKEVTVRGSFTGAGEVARGYDQIASSADNAATVTEKVTKAQEAADKALDKLRRQYQDGYRDQQNLASAERVYDRAVQQGLLTKQQASAELANVRTRIGQATTSQRALAAATQAANDNIRNMTSSAGPAGAILSAMGPAGIAAAAGIGAAVIAIHQMVSAATSLADRAGKLKDFAETTGFTVLELQALEKAGAQVGVSSEAVTKSLERFSVQMAEVRLRTGETYEKLLALNPELARQVAGASSLQQAYDLLSKAIKNTDVERANQIARAFFGRGGVEQTRLMRAVADADGLKGLVAQMHQADAITAQQAERWDTLGDKIAENMKAAKQNIASIFTEPVLEAAERFSKSFLDFSREMKTFEVSERFQKLMEFFSNPVTQGALAGALAGARGGLLGAGVGAIVGGGAAAIFDAADKTNAAEAVQKLRYELEQLERSKAIATQKVLDAVDPADIQKYAAILERTSQRILEIQKELGEAKKPPLITITPGPKGYESDAEGAARAAERLRQETIASYNEMARWMGVIGNAATLAERYELATRKLAASKAEGKINEEQYGRAVAEQKQQLELRLGVADMEAVTLDKLAQVREVAAKAGLSDEKTRLALSISLRESRQQEMAAWARANPEMAEAKNLAQDFTQTLAQGLMDGKSGTDMLISALDQLKASLLNSGIKDLFSGDPLTMAIGAVKIGAAFVVDMFSDDMKAAKELQKAKDAFAGMSDEVRDFNRAADGFETSSLVTAIRQIEKTGMELIKAAVAAEDFGAAVQLIQSGVRQVNNTIDEFVRPKNLSEGADQIGQANNTASQLIAELDELNRQYNLGFNRTAEILAAAADQVRAIQQKIAATLQADINSASGLDYVNDLNELIDKRDQFLREQAATGVDTSLIERWFQVQAQKVVDGAGLIGDSFNDLITMFPSLSGIIRESTDALQEQAEAQQRLMEQQRQAFEALAKDINDFIRSLQYGSNSTLTPAQQFGAAQSDFNAQAQLALAKDPTAISNITKFADTYLTQARSYLGPSEAFGLISSQVVTMLQQILAANSVPGAGAITGDLTLPQPLAAGVPTSGGVAPVSAVANDNRANIAGAIKSLEVTVNRQTVVLQQALDRLATLEAEQTQSIEGLRIDTRLSAQEAVILAGLRVVGTR